MSNPKRTEGQPHDRLTRISAAMTDAFETHPERQKGDRCMVFLDSDTKGGIALSGWEDDGEAITALVVHLRAMFQANGMDLDIITIPNDVSGLDE